MKTLIFILLTILPLSASFAQSANETSATDTNTDGWIELFDGKDLKGWTPKFSGYPLGKNYKNTFRVEDGILKVSYDQYDHFNGEYGHLFYKKKFSSYRLRAVYRFVGQQVPGGAGWAVRNNGLMLYCQSPESMRIDQDYPVSVETQLLGGTGQGRRPTANVCTPGTNVVIDGKLVTQHCNESTSDTYDGDQWVTVEVEVHADSLIRQYVNGNPVFEYSKPQIDPNDPDGKRLLEEGKPKMLKEGYISIQAESHPTEFRKIELKPIKE